MERELKKVKVNIFMREGRERILIEAYTTPVAGLVLHPRRDYVTQNRIERIIVRRNSWDISLYPVGLRVFGDIPSYQQAYEITTERLAKYSWIAFTAKDVQDSNDMNAMSAEAVEIRRLIAKMQVQDILPRMNLP
jgi:hypothetical protein